MEDGWRLSDVFATAVSSAKSAGRYAPNGMTVKTAVMLVVVLLQTFGSAFRANATLVQPVAVGVEAILDMIFVDGDF